METTKKDQDMRSSDHKAIPLPENMDRADPKGKGNSPQSTVGSSTPGKSGKKDMSEAAERKARRDGAEAGTKEEKAERTKK